MGARLTGDARAAVRTQAAELYKAGHGIDDVAAQLGRSRSLVHTLLIEANVPRRPRGNRVKPHST